MDLEEETVKKKRRQTGHNSFCHDESFQFKDNIIMHPRPKRYTDLEREPLSEAEQEILMDIVSGDLEPEVLDEGEEHP